MKNILFAIVVATAVLPLPAQNQLSTKKVTIFKNATALVVKEGTLPLNNSTATLPIPGQTLFGTFFLGSTKDNTVKNVVFKNDTLKKPDQSRSVWQYLAGNLNKAVTIYYTPTQGIDKSVSGKAVSYDMYSGMLKFATDAGKTIVMHVASIYQADFKDDPSPTYTADSLKRQMILKADKPANDIALQEIYMTTGINWLPSYFLKLKDDKTAHLEMKATIENYAEDLKDADVELTVGAPQMTYSTTLDPMTYDYITSTNYYNSNTSYNYLQSNAMDAPALEQKAVGGANTYEWADFSTEGEKSDDLYIYKLGKVTLPKNSKGAFPIFAGNVDYKDKYEGTINDFTNFYVLRYCPTDEKTFDIYHSLEVKNTSTVPLTTAAVMVMNDKDQFVAQDQLKYTPAGATTNIRLSKAIDMIMKNTEEEKNREDNAKKVGKVVYSKVYLKGTVNVENYQDKEVTVTITKSLNGTVTATGNDGKTTKKNPYSAINPYSEIKWEVKLAPGEKKALTYDYEVFFTP